MKPQYQTNFKHHIKSDSCPYYNPNKDNHAMNSHHLHVPVNQGNSNVGNAKSFTSKSNIQDQSKTGNLSGYLKPSTQNHNIPQIQGQNNLNSQTPTPIKNTPYIPLTKFKQSHIPEMIKSQIHDKNYGITNKVQKVTSDGKDKQSTFYQPTIFSRKIPRISQTNVTQTPLKIIEGTSSHENKSNLLIKNRINQQQSKQIPSFIKNKQKDSSIPLIKYKRISTCQNESIDTLIEQKQEIKTKQFLIYPQRNSKYKNIEIKNENLQIKTNNQIKSSSIIKSYKIKKQHKFIINDFEKIKQLGCGKFGHVNLVREKLSGFICALKIISKKLLQEKEIIEQLIRELKIQIYLNHPNIIKMYGYFHDENYIYIILEVGTGGQLYHLYQKKNYNNNNNNKNKNNNNNNSQYINQNKIAFIMKQICQAINEIHSQRIIHRDIKPQNIVLQDNVIKLCDFGWSVHQNNKLRQTFCGTPLYVCPEILKGNSYDQKIDIWSLGIMMYQILIGQNPFKINKEQQLVKIIKNQICIPSYVYLSYEARDFIDKCLKKNPNQRASIRQLLQHQFFMKNPDKNDQKIGTE